MRILITNDDGILAPGLACLEQIAQNLAGPDGEVWIVAPSGEQSGVGHCISYTHPFMAHEHGERRVGVDGSPADCILAALHHVMPQKPDLILSGVNKGNNSAENTVYSGTIGAAMEGALQGIPAVALSQFFGPLNADLKDPFEAALHHGAGVIQACLKAGFTAKHGYRTFYNVNFPPVPADQVKGRVAAPQGYRKDGAFALQSTQAPNGRTFLWAHGFPQQDPTAPGTDAAVNLDGYISVTPMRADLTVHDALAPLQEILD